MSPSALAVIAARSYERTNSGTSFRWQLAKTLNEIVLAIKRFGPLVIVSGYGG